MDADTERDPYSGFSFHIEVEGISMAGFTTASGLMDGDVHIAWREGTEDPMRRPHPEGPQTITLKLGCGRSGAWWAWLRGGQTDRRRGTITMRDETGRALRQWNFRDAWVSELDAPPPHAAREEGAIENVALIHEGIASEP